MERSKDSPNNDGDEGVLFLDVEEVTEDFGRAAGAYQGLFTALLVVLLGAILLGIGGLLLSTDPDIPLDLLNLLWVVANIVFVWQLVAVSTDETWIARSRVAWRISCFALAVSALSLVDAFVGGAPGAGQDWIAWILSTFGTLAELFFYVLLARLTQTGARIIRSIELERHANRANQATSLVIACYVLSVVVVSVFFATQWLALLQAILIICVMSLLAILYWLYRCFRMLWDAKQRFRAAAWREDIRASRSVHIVHLDE